MEKANILRAVTYMRFGSAEQAKKKLKVVLFARGPHCLCVDEQRKRIRERLLAYENILIVNEYAADGQADGSTAQDVKKRILRYVMREKCDLVVMTSLDRWTRKIQDFLDSSAQFARHGCFLVSLDKFDDALTALGSKEETI